MATATKEKELTDKEIAAAFGTVRTAEKALANGKLAALTARLTICEVMASLRKRAGPGPWGEIIAKLGYSERKAERLVQIGQSKLPEISRRLPPGLRQHLPLDLEGLCRICATGEQELEQLLAADPDDLDPTETQATIERVVNKSKSPRKRRQSATAAARRSKATNGADSVQKHHAGPQDGDEQRADGPSGNGSGPSTEAAQEADTVVETQPTVKCDDARGAQPAADHKSALGQIAAACEFVDEPLVKAALMEIKDGSADSGTADRAFKLILRCCKLLPDVLTALQASRQ